MRQRFLVIHNCQAGRHAHPLMTGVVRELERAGASVAIENAPSQEADTRIARDAARTAEFDAIVAAGGDSTIRGVASGLMGSNVPLGIIPVGTGNVLAEEIGFAKNAVEIARHLRLGPTETISGGIANSEPFFAMAGAGYDARVLERLDIALKRRIGKLAYGPAILAELSARPHRFEVTIDGAKLEASWIVVAKAARYGGAFVIAPGHGLTSDGFIAVVVDARTRAELLSVLLSLARGRIAHHARVRLLPCRQVHIEGPGEIAAQIDGERLTGHPIEITVAPEPIRLIYPAPARA